MLNISVDEYEKRSISFENALNNEYKKNHGVFYTDARLSKLIINYLKIGENQSVLDPCCGTGSFLYAALKCGCKNVYGADIHADAVKICKSLTGLDNLHVTELDTLGENGSKTLKIIGLVEQADYIVGNPPYGLIEKDIIMNTNDKTFQKTVRTSGNNLFIAALYRAFELAKENGVIAYIIPKNFLHVRNYSCLRKLILRKKTVISIIDIGAYFQNVRGEQIILIVQNCYIQNNDIKILKLVDDSFQEICSIRQESYCDEILLFKSEREYVLYRGFEENYPKLLDMDIGYISRGKSQSASAIPGKEIKKFGFKHHPVPDKGNQIFIQNIYSAESGIIASFAGNKNELEAGQTVTVLTSNDENICRYIVGILHSRLCNFYLLKFCYNSSKLTMHTDAKYLSRLPVQRNKNIAFSKRLVYLVKALEKADYMSEDWFTMVEDLNQIVYQIYDVNDSDREYIDKEMALLQSGKWMDGRSKQKM